MRRRDQFLAMLSHELRNPLGAVVTATALLKHEAASAKRRRSAPRILERQSRQMARLLDDLLEASRVTQNKIELRKRRSTQRGGRGRRRGGAATMAARGVAFTVDLEAEPLSVDGDPRACSRSR